MNRIINKRGKRAFSALVCLLALGVCASPVLGPAGQAFARGPQHEQQGFQPGRGQSGPPAGRGAAQAAPNRPAQGQVVQGRSPRGRPSPGVVNNLPKGHGKVKYKGRPYYFHGGRYYRPHGRGYVVVPPPRRMIVPRLPIGFATLVIAGITYYSYLGVYYQQVPTGYMIVGPPAGAPPPVVSPAYSTVSVVAAALNVRQGPGASYPVLFVVNLGETLNVLATAPGWLYVQTAAGQTGWVDQRFTSPLAPAASG